MSNSEEAKANLLIRVFGGDRRPIDPDINPLITIRDGFQNQFLRRNFKAPNIQVEVPFFNNLGDNYTVLVSAKGHRDAGFTPDKVSRDVQKVVDLMLLPKKVKFNFDGAGWSKLKQNHRQLYDLLSHGLTEAKAESRYDRLIKDSPGALAALLNITTAMTQIHLPQGTPMDYLKEIIWDDSMKQDRFFAYADEALIEQVKTAAEHGEFAPEVGAGLFHAGATRSYKQGQFGEANVQLSFHENEKRNIDG